MQHVMRKVISHPGNPSMGVSKLPDLCPRLYMGACTERKLDDVRLARLVLHVPITAVLLLELRNLLLCGCLAPLPLIAKLLRAVPATALANSGRAPPTAAPHHATVQQPCAPPAAVLAIPAPPRRFLEENNRQGLTIAVIPLPARLLGRGCVQ